MTNIVEADLKTIAQRWIQGWQHGQIGIIDELHAADFVDHDSAGRPNDRAGFKQGVVDLYTAFPNFHAVIDDLIIDSSQNKVAIRWSATGTHQGRFLGAAPTSKQIRFKGIEIIKIKNNMIIERWGEWDSSIRI